MVYKMAVYTCTCPPPEPDGTTVISCGCKIHGMLLGDYELIETEIYSTLFHRDFTGKVRNKTKNKTSIKRCRRE